MKNNKLPQGWVECLIKDIAKNIQYGYTESANMDKIGPRFLRITDIQNDNVNWNLVPYCKIDDNIKSKYLLENGDFVFVRTGATVGKSYLIENLKEESVYASYLIRIRFYDISFTKYVKYYFQTSNYWNQISENKVGIGQPNVNGTVLSNLKIPFPPLNEQRRIVEKIESEFAKIDEGLEHLENAKEQIKQYRQSVLKSAFDGKLYKTSEWKETTLGEVVEPRRERITPNDKNGNMVFIGMDCIEPNSLYIHNQYKLKETKSVAFEFYKNDVLYGRMRSYLNKVWEATCNGTASAEFIVFPENDNIFSSYLKYLLHQQNFVKYATRNASGDRPRVKFESDLADYKFRLPSIEEQKKIVEEIEKRFAVADEVEKVVEENIEKAKQLKQSILKKAFEGRLVPQDPTDEPASILLEKIKQERRK